jgi:mannonate dehydratase
MKLGLGLYRQLLNPETLRFARQAGVTHIVAHLPGYFVRENAKIITSDQAAYGFGVSEADDPIWTGEGLRDLKSLVNSEGLELEALENFAPAHWYDVLLDGPRRAEQMARVKQILRDVGQAGIRTMGYSFTIAGVWGRTEGAFARGGARSVGFENPAQPPIPAGMVWNMVYDRERFDPENPKETVGPVSPEEIWRRFAGFLREMMPVAEEAGVKLALHPDDPPLPTLRGRVAARLPPR